MSQATLVMLIAIPVGVSCAIAVAYAASAPNSQVLRSIRLALVGAVIATFVAIVLIIGLRLNFTASMPLGIYRLDHVAPSAMQRGMLVAVCAPAGAAEQGRRLRYIATGVCSGNSEPLLKTIAAIAGDIITVGSDGVSVNGHLLRNSKPLEVDSSGRPMTRWPIGRYRISRGAVWLYANHERSWDSRYWGPVPTRNILASVAPVVVIGRH
jgi:conjugative transfer signal peptidase TraF